MLARPAAVKLIRPDRLGLDHGRAAENLVRRFEREAQATAALHSPHTVELYDFGVTREGTFYYVMEILDGLDLESLVRRFGPVPAQRAAHLLLQHATRWTRRNTGVYPCDISRQTYTRAARAGGPARF